MAIKLDHCKSGSLHLIGVPTKWRRHIVKNTRWALQRVSKVLGYKKGVEIVIFSAPPHFIIPEIGITGRALLKTPSVTIHIDFNRRDIKKVVTRRLHATIYHEMSHIVRESVVGWGKTFLDNLVGEGIASYTEKFLDSKAEVPYVEKIRNESKLWKKAKTLLTKRNYGHSDWFFGSEVIPRWAGYRLGYIIVEKFMRNRSYSLDKLTRTPSKEILRGSNL